MIHHHNNNVLSILSGSVIGVGKYLYDLDFMTYGAEMFKVFAFGVLGGAGGLIGKLIIEKAIKLIKRK